MGKDFRDQVLPDNDNRNKSEQNFIPVSVNQAEAGISLNQLETDDSENEAETVKQSEANPEPLDDDERSVGSGDSSQLTMRSASNVSDSLDFDGSRFHDETLARRARKAVHKKSTSVKKPVDRKTKSNKDIRKGVEGKFWVEYILKSRIESDGTKSYLTKWKGYSRKSNSWEPKDSFDPEFLAAYEKRTANNKIFQATMTENKQHEPAKTATTGPSGNRTATLKSTERYTFVAAGRSGVKSARRVAADSRRCPLPTKQPRFEEEGYHILDTETNLAGRRIRMIVGMTYYRGGRFFVVEFESDDSDSCSLVKADHMNFMFPEQVIRFYEDKITWDYGDAGV